VAFLGLGGVDPGASKLLLFRTSFIIRFVIFFAISPLLFLLYRTNFKKYKSEFWFVVFGFVLYFFLGAQTRYLVTLLPLSILLLTDVIKKREIKWHIILSVVLFIGIITIGTNPFKDEHIKIINEDVSKIAKDFPNERFIVAEAELHQTISDIYWGGDIKELIGWKEYLISIGEEDNYLDYSFESDSKINDERKLLINFKLLQKSHDLNIHPNV